MTIDSLFTKAYSIVTQMARIGNLIWVHLLVQSQMLQLKGKDLGDTSDAPLHFFGLMTKGTCSVDVHFTGDTVPSIADAGTNFGTNVRQSLCCFPMLPEQLFGPEAKKALEWWKQSSQFSEVWVAAEGAPLALCCGKCDMQSPTA